jgi:ERCC4-type nuclease
MSATIVPLLLIDIRETAFIAFLEANGYKFQAVNLMVGDFQISARVCGEIKRIKFGSSTDFESYNDLAASLKDDRVHYQSNDRHNLFEVNYLILEIQQLNGKDAPVACGWFDQQKLDSLLLTLELSFDVHIKITHTMKETADFIYMLYEHELKGPKFVEPTNPAPRPKTLYEQQLYFLSGLLGCGYVKAKQLLDLDTTPLAVIKRIRDTEILTTKTGNPKGINPEMPIKGFGPTFFLENQALLLLDGKEYENK